MKYGTSLLLPVVFFAVPASADENQAYFDQSGSNNVLYIDQSGDGAVVQGLTLTQAGRTFEMKKRVPVRSGPGSGRRGPPHDVPPVGLPPFDPPSGTPGVPDFVTAGHKEVGGPGKKRKGPGRHEHEPDYEWVPVDITADVLGFEAADRALQSGEHNRAEIVMSGGGGAAMLYQHGDHNIADIDMTGALIGAIGQDGYHNTATLALMGDARGAILQDGNHNKAKMTVGEGGDGWVSQIGSGNRTGHITVAPGASLTYVQQGDGLGPVGRNGFSLKSGTTVHVTQSSW